MVQLHALIPFIKTMFKVQVLHTVNCNIQANTVVEFFSIYEETFFKNFPMATLFGSSRMVSVASLEVSKPLSCFHIVGQNNIIQNLKYSYDSVIKFRELNKNIYVTDSWR